MNRSNAFAFSPQFPQHPRRPRPIKKHQLFWFSSEIVGQVGAGLILIRETNGRGHVGGALGEKFCSYKEQVEVSRQKKWEQRGGVNIK